MNQKERYLEENVARLLNAGFGGAARQDFQTKKRTLQHLITQLREQKVATEFPDIVLVFIVCILIFIGVWMAAQILGPGVPEVMRLLFIIPTLILVINLAFVPVTTILIIIWRKNYV